jgi:hypothetical protein
MAYVRNGRLHNIDNPLNEEYHGVGMRADLTGKHYGELRYLHVIRPRGLTDQHRTNLQAWIDRFMRDARRIYPKQLAFNDDYNAPKFKPNQPLDFVRQIAQTALGQASGPPIAAFCSEFAWALLALRGCHPEQNAADFQTGGVPACVSQPMRPMPATGNYVFSKRRSSYTGLADGPLVILDGLRLAPEQRKATIAGIFAENPNGLAKMSEGHRKVAQEFQPKFARLSSYYAGATGNALQRLQARFATALFTRDVPMNYSPTSYLINTLLPSNNFNRRMDYIATIAIE